MRHHLPRNVDERRAARRLDIVWYRPPDGPPPAWWPISPEPLAYLDELVNGSVAPVNHEATS